MDRVIRARAVLAELAALGLTVDDLTAAAANTGARAAVGEEPAGVVVPSVAAYVEVVAAGYRPGTAATYRSAWRILTELFGEAPITAVTADDCHQVVTEARARARERRPGSDGRSSAETCVGALRAVFGRAVVAGLRADDPTKGIAKPRRLDSRRRALTDPELDEVVRVAAATSRDPALDLLLIRFHLETGARRDGALTLRLGALDRARQTVWLVEKFGARREQPVSASLLHLLTDHATDRGAAGPDDAVFRIRGGRPISRRHYNTLFDHIQRRLEWTARTPVTAHVLRHTAITRVERHAGYGVAVAFAGHSQTGTVTGTYIKATVEEVAAAVAALTNETHPLAPPP